MEVCFVFYCLVLESELLDRIKKNKVSKALYLIQKALLVQKNEGLNNSNNQTKSLLQVTHMDQCSYFLKQSAHTYLVTIFIFTYTTVTYSKFFICMPFAGGIHFDRKSRD